MAIGESHHENGQKETTLFDKPYGLRQEYDLLLRIPGDLAPPTGFKMAIARNRGKTDKIWAECVQTTVQMAQTTLRSDIVVLEGPSSIMNEEKEDFLILREQLSLHITTTTIEDINRSGI